ncbi:uncharacterized protein C6orf163 homolog [Ambystoma mexicanum]|uniref:uncharacterized protein C6orf163 homolog n=1 Tax=Ambystoma mexicanum TaxID=8296 RepID=UPI0037E77344
MARECRIKSYEPYDLTTGDKGPSSSTYNLLREYRCFKTRSYAHKRILEIGANLEREYHDGFEAERRRSLDSAEAATWWKAEVEKETAVEKALERAKEEHEAALAELKKKQKKAMQVAVNKAEENMQQLMQTEVQKAQEMAKLEHTVETTVAVNKAEENMQQLMQTEVQKAQEMAKLEHTVEMQCTMKTFAEETIRIVSAVKRQQKRIALKERQIMKRYVQ